MADPSALSPSAPNPTLSLDLSLEPLCLGLSLPTQPTRSLFNPHALWRSLACRQRNAARAVVVAVLLDEFISFIAREKEEAERLRAAELEKMRITGCLDPLTKTLVTLRERQQDT
jgi:hypothetical protein